MTKLWWGVGGVIVVGLLVWAGNFCLQLYQQWSQQRYIASVEVLKAEYKNDTYGGATPEETLQMFIKAFQAGDLELASKYFVAEKQGEELRILNNAPQENIYNLMNILKTASEWRSGAGSDSFIMEAKLNSKPSMFVSFIKYPSDNWKINEI